jgi:uncharacterized BrkB/YihY/UPF0761 family membrane protein
MLTWLWLSALALLIGGEINAEAHRSHNLCQRTPPPDRPAVAEVADLRARRG